MLVLIPHAIQITHTPTHRNPIEDAAARWRFRGFRIAVISLYRYI
tara:strand:- start:343 stop:477 length:135 start_codon:yes stop_codon:yes gene_type:complete